MSEPLMISLATMLSTVPEAKQDEVRDILMRTKHMEERDRRNTSATADKQSILIALATLMMDVWTPSMRRRIENLILNKAIEKGYLKMLHVKFVFALDSEDIVETDWIVEDKDEMIVKLIWETFNMKQHFEDVHNHRMWLQRSHERLKGVIPSIDDEIIERHDLSKFSFSQAVGYTLRFVHNTYHDIWKKACDHHLHNELHHIQAWSKMFTPEQKQNKVKKWTMETCDFSSTNGPYGLNMSTIDFASDNLAEVFLWESFLDMVAVEWERKKGQKLDISLPELVYMEDKFLTKYSVSQQRMIKDFMIDASEIEMEDYEDNLSEREKILLSTVGEGEKTRIIKQMTSQKKEKLCFHCKGQKGTVSDDIQKQILDEIYHITVATVVMDYWHAGLRKQVEKLVLQKAIEEGYIKESHLQWITVLENIDVCPVTEGSSGSQIPSGSAPINVLVKMIWEEFNAREHFNQMKHHRDWLMRSYQRLLQFVPEVPEDVIERHDLSKFAFSQAIGYTLKWVHKISHPVWYKACDFHLYKEPHHPQMWSKAQSSSSKVLCLESWLCVQAGGSKYGIEPSTLNLASEDMAKLFLYESFLDMVAIEWERKKGGQLSISNSELVGMEHRFLQRYTFNDRKLVLQIMNVVREAEANAQ